jgi:hypothetical protein
VVEHSIGNGEVDSSILSGSTIFLGLASFAFQEHLRSEAENQRKSCGIFRSDDGSGCGAEAMLKPQKLRLL